MDGFSKFEPTRTYVRQLKLPQIHFTSFRKNSKISCKRIKKSIYAADSDTLDHILSLHFSSNTLAKCKKMLFCAFIDFKQALNKVWRNSFWYKLLSNGIDGNCSKYITNMYKGINHLIIRMNGTVSDFLGHLSHSFLNSSLYHPRDLMGGAKYANKLNFQKSSSLLPYIFEIN